jgi:hypothetical protein
MQTVIGGNAAPAAAAAMKASQASSLRADAATSTKSANGKTNRASGQDLARSSPVDKAAEHWRRDGEPGYVATCGGTAKREGAAGGLDQKKDRQSSNANRQPTEQNAAMQQITLFHVERPTGGSFT